MSMIKIFTDPCCNLDSDTLRNYDIEVLPYIITIGDNVFPIKTEYESFTPEWELESMKSGNVPSLSRPSIGEWMIPIKDAYEKGFDILYVGMSHKLTGSYNSLKVIGELLRDEFPERNLYFYDTLSCSWGEGYMVLESSKLCRNGKSYEDICAVLDSIRDRIDNWFLPFNTKIWEGTHRGTSSKGLKEDCFNLLTCDREGNFIPYKSFESRKDCIDSLKDSFKDSEVWISFTKDVPDGERDYVMSLLGENSKICLCCPPFTTFTFGNNTIELSIIRNN